VQVKNRDGQLAKAKRMMVALNNKFKAKFAKMEEMNAAKVEAMKEAPAGSEGGVSQRELDEAKKQLAACQRTVDELHTTCVELRSQLATSCDAANEESEKDAEIAELREAVEEVSMWV